MHYRGKAMALEAIYPDRRVELLTYVPRFDVMWQVTYPYAEPAGVPGRHGAAPDVVARQLAPRTSAIRIRRTGSGSGNRTIDEMSIGHIDFIYLSDEEYAAGAARARHAHHAATAAAVMAGAEASR